MLLRSMDVSGLWPERCCQCHATCSILRHRGTGTVQWSSWIPLIFWSMRPLRFSSPTPSCKGRKDYLEKTENRVALFLLKLAAADAEARLSHLQVTCETRGALRACCLKCSLSFPSLWQQAPLKFWHSQAPRTLLRLQGSRPQLSLWFLHWRGSSSVAA